jgi:chromosome partitioning protein
MSHIIAVLNQKGGVGKTTTTTINLAAFLAKDGHSVLLVDLDPQGNSTSGLGFDKQKLTSTLYDVLFSRAQANQTIQKINSKFYILPSNADLAGAEVEMVGLAGREQLLRKVLADLNYDYILIDCPPSLGLLTINALTAAHSVLIPVQAEYYALEGLSQLLSVIQQVRQALNPSLDILGVLITLYDSRNSLSNQVKKELESYFGAKLFQTVVPRNVRLAEAPSFGRTIIEHDKWSKGARAYKTLTREVEKRREVV